MAYTHDIPGLHAYKPITNDYFFFHGISVITAIMPIAARMISSSMDGPFVDVSVTMTGVGVAMSAKVTLNDAGANGMAPLSSGVIDIAAISGLIIVPLIV